MGTSRSPPARRASVAQSLRPSALPTGSVAPRVTERRHSRSHALSPRPPPSLLRGLFLRVHPLPSPGGRPSTFAALVASRSLPSTSIASDAPFLFSSRRVQSASPRAHLWFHFRPPSVGTRRPPPDNPLRAAPPSRFVFPLPLSRLFPMTANPPQSASVAARFHPGPTSTLSPCPSSSPPPAAIRLHSGSPPAPSLLRFLSRLFRPRLTIASGSRTAPFRTRGRVAARPSSPRSAHLLRPLPRPARSRSRTEAVTESLALAAVSTAASVRCKSPSLSPHTLPLPPAGGRGSAALLLGSVCRFFPEYVLLSDIRPFLSPRHDDLAPRGARCRPM